MRKRRILFLLLALALLLSACAGPLPANGDENAEVDGGRTDKSDPNAPKTIASTELVSFSCEFSTFALDEEESGLEVGFFTCAAEKKDGKTEGTYRFRGSDEDSGEKRFAADASFLQKLETLVRENGLAQYNGKNAFVAGLPDNFGATLSVDYASGERIYASDNQDNFLPLDAMRALQALFESACTDAPMLLDLTVQTEYVYDEVNGQYLSDRYPVIAAGVTDWDGVARTVGVGNGLYAALEAYNDDVRQRNADSFRQLQEIAKELPADGTSELYVESDLFVTRNDSAVVSFYERMKEAGLLRETRSVRSRNIDTASGRLLGWADAFTDPASLPELLNGAFRAQYPDLRVQEDAAELLKNAIDSEDESLCFVLEDGAVRFFAAEYFLVPAWDELSVTLTYADYPELVKERYRASAPTRLTRMEYDADYSVDGSKLRMTYRAEGEYQDEIKWTLTVDGNALNEDFYAYAPECQLLRANGKNYLYLRVPATDVSMQTFIYEITPDGAKKIGEAPLAPAPELNLNPERMQMELDDFFYAEPVSILTVGMYCVGADGLPELVREDYGVRSAELELTNFASVPSVDPSDPTREGEKTDIPAGTRLKPFRTDKKSYLDFTDADGSAVRFRITEFGENMELVDFGKINEVFCLPGE
ncbi:MAG: hypothetical protein Q3977_02145 [Oscillospiraceae bacterium]|nr:hypothetical protein [Oscillospiraceae bacterium]